MFGKNKDQADLEMFAMYDSKTESYNNPIFSVNRLDIIRDLQNMCKDPEQAARNKYFTNAEDFSLFKIGAYTRKNGLVQGNNPEHVANMHEIRAAVEREKRDSRPQGIVST